MLSKSYPISIKTAALARKDRNGWSIKGSWYHTSTLEELPNMLPYCHCEVGFQIPYGYARCKKIK